MHAAGRGRGQPVEHTLRASFRIRPAQIGPSLARFFGVSYEPFYAGRIRSEMLTDQQVRSVCIK
jgi:hypothetical protein